MLDKTKRNFYQIERQRMMDEIERNYHHTDFWQKFDGRSTKVWRSSNESPMKVQQKYDER
jgi:hypothetical protein